MASLFGDGDDDDKDDLFKEYQAMMKKIPNSTDRVKTLASMKKMLNERSESKQVRMQAAEELGDKGYREAGPCFLPAAALSERQLRLPGDEPAAAPIPVEDDGKIPDQMIVMAKSITPDGTD
eukprot:4556156-Pyramimonas_sp.AAC.1